MSQRVASAWWLVLASLTVGASIAALNVVVLGGDARDDSAVVAERSAVAGEPFARFQVLRANRSLTFFQGSLEEVPEEPFGAYFMNLETGAVEGWYDPRGQMLPGLISGDNRLVSFHRDRNAVFGFQHAAQLLLTDRKTGAIYYWEGPAELVRSSGGSLAGSEGRFLLRTTDREGDLWLAAVALDPEPHVYATFEARGTWGLLSADGGKAAVLDETLHVVDLATGRVTTAAGSEAGEVPLPAGRPVMRNTADGSGFVVALDGGEGSPGRWLRIDWDGNVLASGGGAEFYLSADGSMVAVLTPFEGAEAVGTNILTAFDTRSGRTQFRVVGVGPTPRLLDNAHRWLADNSGILFSSSGSNSLLARRDGRVQSQHGVPSPSEVGVYATSALVAPSADGESEVTRYGMAGVSPWGDSGSERRFRLPQLGFDSGTTTLLLQPYVEPGPDFTPPRLQLREEALGLELWEKPGGSVVVGTLTDVSDVLIHESSILCAGPPDNGDCVSAGFEYYVKVATLLGVENYTAHTITGLWVRVTTTDGQRGWLLWSLSPNWL